mmetsp:Transcript_4463/g.8457  ORF Transcript_4463/g.8457 Transcript_4463/m.8457 type:complete len:326 (-) Transcript_4463:255-1232(-)
MAAVSSGGVTLTPAEIKLFTASIERLRSVQGANPRTEVNLPEDDIVKICRAARNVFLSQPILLELQAPLSVCGDVHGQFYDLLRVFEMNGFPGEPGGSGGYLFLGDYVDRARQSIETICLLLCYKLLHQETFFLLRGNHECATLNRIYGFFDECKRRYNVRLWRIFCDCFNCMPVAAVIGDKIFCTHGGLSPELDSPVRIKEIQRPTEVADEGLLCDLLWSDPDPDIRGWGSNLRGVSYTFGHDVIAEFLSRNDFDLVCRAHQVVEDGYEFQADRKLVTIFTAPNYCGEFDNAGGILIVKKNMQCSFKILRPGSHLRKSAGGGGM